MFVVRDEPVFEHRVEDVAPTGLVETRAFAGRVSRGRLDRRGEGCALRERQFLRVDAEVGLRRRLYAVRAPPEVHGVQVQLQNLVLAVRALDLQREPDFLQLAAHGLFCAQVRELRQLLGDGARALGEGACAQVAAQRAEDAVDVDAAVLVKAKILRGDERQLRLPGDPVKRDDRTVFRTSDLRDQLVVAVVHAGRLRKRVQALRVKALPVRYVKDDHEPDNERQKDGKRDARREDQPLLRPAQNRPSRKNAVISCFPANAQTMHAYSARGDIYMNHTKKAGGISRC